MKFLMTLCFLSFITVIFAQVNPNHHYVKGYHRSDGTYVKGHYRTNPNNTNRDNYSTRPNVNPWTGERGYIAPDNKPLPSYSRTYKSPPAIQYRTTSSSANRSPNITNSYPSHTTDIPTWTGNVSVYKRPSGSSILSEAITYHHRQYNLKQRQVIETILYDLNLDPGLVDGQFTNQTVAAVKRLQQAIGVTADGMCGPKTLNRLITIIE